MEEPEKSHCSYMYVSTVLILYSAKRNTLIKATCVKPHNYYTLEKTNADN